MEKPNEGKNLSTLVMNESVLVEDIEDFLDENPVDEINDSLDELDACIAKMEKFRTSYRLQHEELKMALEENYEEKYGKKYVDKIASMKLFIQQLSNAKRSLRDKDGLASKVTAKSNERTINFQMDEIVRILMEMEYTFGGTLKQESDAEIKRRYCNLSHQMNGMEILSQKFKCLMEMTPIDLKMEENMEILKLRYESLLQNKDAYCAELVSEYESREIDKHNSFNSAMLNIQLGRFSGYSSAVDIYTFQSMFEKLFLNCTPTCFLPDLLKNNYLSNPALLLVQNVDDISEIWKRLKDAYGDQKSLLTRKLAEIEKLDGLWRCKESEKVIDTLNKIINTMKDLIRLAKEHSIGKQLFYSDALERIYRLFDDGRITRWISSCCSEDLEEEKKWEKFILFLEKEVKVCQQKVIIKGKATDRKQKPVVTQKYQSHFAAEGTNTQVRNISTTCYICGETDHAVTNGPNGMKLVQYFACKKFVDMTPNQRFLELKKNGYCIQCLFPGASFKRGKHREGKCQKDFCCRHPYHNMHTNKKHVLVCEEHKEHEYNKQLLEEYKRKFILKSDVPEFSKEIKLSFQGQSVNSTESYTEECNDKAIYMLQTIKVQNQNFCIFFDSGCGDFVSRYSAVQQLNSLSKRETAGPIEIRGVGGISTKSAHGIYSVMLPLADGRHAVMSGVCLENIAMPFPKYPLQGKVEDDIRDSFLREGGDINKLPRLPNYVGGNVDFLIGIKYLRYFPEQIYQLPSGLTIYKSCFQNADGSYGVIGGPHQVFTEIERYNSLCNSTVSMFCSDQLQLYRLGLQVNPDVPLLSCKDVTNQMGTSFLEEHQDISDAFVSNQVKIFREVEEAGSEIKYRCVKCRLCPVCKCHDRDEEMSIKEEVEQDLIDRSITINIQERVTSANLPLIHDPAVKLEPNKQKALKVYNQQLKRLSANQKDKESVISSEGKLQSMGFVDFVKNLPESTQKLLSSSPVQNFIPWRVGWKKDSLSTPCRLVFDPSQPTASGFSLNDIVAKGRNNMNKLVEIFIRWRSHRVAFHTDVQKMYNTVKLNESDWCLQRYIWQQDLDPAKIPEDKVIKTLIYGVKSSGNQAERALRQTAQLFKETYPEVHKIVTEDVYVDDCISGEVCLDKAKDRADQLELVLNHGGFKLKGFTVSGSNPDEALTSDGYSILVAGLRWYPRKDLISLNVKELNFSKKYRGRKQAMESEVPEHLTRRLCVAKVAEVFDLTGMLTPITAAMKLDLHELVKRNLDWDDVIPDSLKSIWKSHFEMMSEINNVKFKRAIIPEDAVSLDLETLDFGDASKSLVCVAIYVRFKRMCGQYSCQLIFSRSRIVPENMTQPRAELYAAIVNTHCGEIVRRALSEWHNGCIKFTDSQIVLHWINNSEKALKQWVRNRVIEIQRFSSMECWKYITSGNMIADIGTRKGCKLNDVGCESVWVNGMDWMKSETKDFPVMTVEQISLSIQEEREAKLEKQQIVPILHSDVNYKIPFEEVCKRYQYSKYLIDPNKFRFTTVVRVLALVIQFVKKLRFSLCVKNSKFRKDISSNPGWLKVEDENIEDAEKYFFRKATLEVKHFLKKAQYENISREKDGILMYTGRILSSDMACITGRMTEVMKDLTASTFCVPVIDKNSPLAYAVVNEVHWFDSTAKHAGVETVWRFVLKRGFIIEGRSLVKKIKRNCERCRYLNKKTVDVAMAPISRYNVTIAPAFYISQLDLAGPFKAYSPHNKRTTVKVWLLVFCCTTTSTTNIKVMDNYSTSGFLQAFTRFACEVGYPKVLLPDEGGQLVKGCESMILDFEDIKFKLHKDVAVDFEVCPVGGHNMHGKVERRIREVKKSIKSNALSNERLSILQWETVTAVIANNINNLPLALGNNVGDFESMDLITPNRLRLGRNNERSPVGDMVLTADPDKISRDNQRIFDAWFENWLSSHVPQLMHQPKWFKTDEHLKEGDIVLFLKNDSAIGSAYQYGRISSVTKGKDGRIRKAHVVYRNSSENVNRETFRAIRELVVIHRVDENNVMKELGEAAVRADTMKYLYDKVSTFASPVSGV